MTLPIIKLRLLAGLLFACLLLSCGEAEGTDDTGSTADNLGQARFNSTCGTSSCHGKNGASGPAPDFPSAIPNLTDEEIEAIVRNGTGSMPSQNLDAEEIAAVIEHLRERFP